jgi:phage internal scaffolding protein
MKTSKTLSLCDIADAHPKFRTAYMAQFRVSFGTTGDSRTKQSFKNECDVNNILKNYNKTGIMPEGNPGDYRDLDGTDYQEYMQTVASANSMFEELPSALRKRFKNDPAQLLSFVHDDKNVDEAHQLGLLRDDYQPPEIMISPPQTAEPIDDSSEAR